MVIGEINSPIWRLENENKREKGQKVEMII